jgi:hypothetical protein
MSGADDSGRAPAGPGGDVPRAASPIPPRRALARPFARGSASAFPLSGRSENTAKPATAFRPLRPARGGRSRRRR